MLNCAATSTRGNSSLVYMLITECTRTHSPNFQRS